MILHIVHDDKFIDVAYDIFEEVHPNQNKYLSIGFPKKKFKYIKKTPVEFISLSNFLLNPFYVNNITSKYELIIIHGFLINKQQFVSKLNKKNIKIIWIGWGGDYYNLINKKLNLPLTEKLLEQIDQSNLETKKLSFREGVKNFVKKIFYNKIDVTKLINKKIDYFAPVIFEDYLLIKNSYPIFNPKFLDWNYGTLEDHLIKDLTLKVEGDDILIGNSAIPENNHLDVFEILKDIDLKHRKVIVPLSYGNKIYAKKIIEFGTFYFGDKFVPLVNFLPINEYQNILKSCSVFIFNHLKQMALGNIVMALYMGGKIFLNDTNPISDFLNRIGVTFFSIQSIKKQNNIIFELSDKEIENNQKALEQYWSKKVILKKTENLIKTALGDN